MEVADDDVFLVMMTKLLILHALERRYIVRMWQTLFKVSKKIFNLETKKKCSLESIKKTKEKTDMRILYDSNRKKLKGGQHSRIWKWSIESRWINLHISKNMICEFYTIRTSSTHNVKKSPSHWDYLFGDLTIFLSMKNKCFWTLSH